MHRFKTVAAVALTAVFAFGTSAAATSEPPRSTQGESSVPITESTPPATAVAETPPPTTGEAPPPTQSVAPEVGTTTTYIDPNIDSYGETTAAPTTNALVVADQAVVVTATVVAEANSGGNVIVEPPQDEGAPQPAEVDSGDAIAVGSDDENLVSQGADIVLEDEATAHVLQVSLILNIGVGLSNSGLNAIVSGSGGPSGGIATGDASATGLDIDQYITQAARESGNASTDAASTQVAISLWLGVAGADSGSNVITGTGVAGGGSVGTGDATAIGNQSLTEISQYASILGIDQSQINVTQRATVLNVGFALANSGINSISGVASGLLTASPTDDNQMAQDLFAMLLPALLQSYGYGPAAGAISTGDATAVGNSSETFIRQVALAASSGDGQVSIVQDVLVANVGAASANTGGNTLGAVRSSTPRRPTPWSRWRRSWPSCSRSSTVRLRVAPLPSTYRSKGCYCG